MDEFQPCPCKKCGQLPVTHHHPAISNKPWLTWCDSDGCEYEGFDRGETAEDSIAAWNRRDAIAADRERRT